MKQAAAVLVLTLVIGCGAVPAAAFNFDINVSDSVVEARIGEEWPIHPNFLSVGVSGIFDADDYTLGALDISVGNPILGRGFKFNMGFKGVAGVVEQSADDDDDDFDDFFDDRADPDEEAEVGAVGFLVSAEYDFPEERSSFPLEITALFCGAPSPMAFLDTETYLEFRTTIGINVLRQEQGTVFVGFRQISIDFDDEYSDLDLSESAAFFGFKLRF